MNIRKLYSIFKRCFKRIEVMFNLLMGLGILITGMYTFLLGFHNMDLSQDLEEAQYLVEIIYGEPFKLVESTIGGELTTDLDEIYRKGAEKVLISAFWLIVGGMLFGIGLRGTYK